MMKYLCPILLLCALSLGSNAYAQAPCPTTAFNGKLACMLPDLYGSGGFSAKGAFGNPTHEGHFDASIAQTLSPLNSDISRETSLLPTASPGSGFSLIFDPALKTFVTTTDSLGPIMGERADTIGRHRIAIGVTYQFFQFDKIDGVDLSNFPAVYTHANDSVLLDGAPPGVTCSSSITGTPDQSLVSYSDNPPHSGANRLGNCSFVRDRIATTNKINLKLHQVMTYVAFGLTKNVEVSVAIPYEDIRFGLSSSATIVTGTYFTDHFFSPALGCTLSSSGDSPACFNHTFPDALVSGSGPSSSSAAGIGDVTVRLKDTIWRGERAGVAAGVDVRFPTGDALNYLGSGAYGVRPFAIVSYHARIAPHAMIGFEANGSSVTNGDLLTGAKGQLPNVLTYDVGVDAYATRRLTGAFDIIGQRIFNTQTVAVTSQQFLAPCLANDFTKPPFPSEPASCDVTVTGSGSTAAYTNVPALPLVSANSLTTTTGTSYNITNASMGVKIALVKRLVLTLNALVRLDNGGLHSKLAPMAGLGYTF
jgi:hypothetical protein